MKLGKNIDLVKKKNYSHNKSTKRLEQNWNFRLEFD